MLDQFVCVRMVRMNGVDLGQFQFDYDLTWAAILLHPDGTVLARYGSRSREGPMALNSLAGLKVTLRRTLGLYDDLDQQRPLLRDKRGPKAAYQTVDQIPSQTIRKIAAREQGKQSCIHCHNVYDAHRDVAISKRQYDPRKRWKYPPPETIGLGVDPTNGTLVTSVAPNSPAAQAGMQPGDELMALNNQAILSLADVQFVLHFLPEQAHVDVQLKRKGKQQTSRVELKPGWRASDMSWRASMYGMPPRPGLWIQALTPDERKQAGIGPKKMALKVRGVFGSDVKKAGIQKNDIIVGLETSNNDLTAGEFQEQIRLNYYRPGDEMTLQLRRRGNPRRVTVRFQGN